MLTSLRIQNFKSWKDTGEMRLAPLTGLFGANSSGKSSILQFLLMLKQTTESPDPNQILDLGDEHDQRDYVNLGTVDDILHRHEGSISDDIKCSFDWIENDTRVPRSFTAEFLLGSEPKGSLVLRSFMHRWKPVKDTADITGYGLAIDLAKSTPTYVPVLEPEQKFEYRSVDSLQPEKFYGFDGVILVIGDTVAARLRSIRLVTLQMDVAEKTNELFRSIYYLGPLREVSRRHYLWAGGTPWDVGRKGEQVISALLGERKWKAPLLTEDGLKLDSAQACVAYWLRRLGLVYSFSVDPVSENTNLYTVRVQQTNDSVPVSLPDVGIGVSQVIPILALLYYVPEGSTVIVEQPEIHLHPRVQSELADVFIHASKTRKIQVILESHSEHLLTRLQRRMAEDTFDHNDAALYFCDMQNGESQLTTLDLDEYGHISNWPKDFFGDEFEERAAAMKAEIDRKQRNSAA